MKQVAKLERKVTHLCRKLKRAQTIIAFHESTSRLGQLLTRLAEPETWQAIPKLQASRGARGISVGYPWVKRRGCDEKGLI